jgi:hypothetical protein
MWRSVSGSPSSEDALSARERSFGVTCRSEPRSSAEAEVAEAAGAAEGEEASASMTWLRLVQKLEHCQREEERCRNDRNANHSTNSAILRVSMIPSPAQSSFGRTISRRMSSAILNSAMAAASADFSSGAVHDAEIMRARAHQRCAPRPQLLGRLLLRCLHFDRLPVRVPFR